MTPVKRDLVCQCSPTCRLRLHGNSVRYGYLVSSVCRNRLQALARHREQRMVGRLAGEFIARVVA